MWNKPFGYSEYIAIDAGLVITGLLLQITVGPIDWSLIAFPANIILLACFLAALATMVVLRRKFYFFRCLFNGKNAVVVLSFVAALTLVMGLIKQDGISLPLGFSKMLGAWWLVLPYVCLTVILGMTALPRTVHFHLRNIPFLLNHWGLFIALTGATLGNADVKELTMQTFPGKPEWRAVTNEGEVTELPLAIELKKFSIEEYPAKLMIIDNNTGNALPGKKPQFVSIDEKQGSIADWNIRVIQYLDYAAPMGLEGSVKFIGWGSDGATEAALVSTFNRKTGEHHKGWISCGSYLFPFQVLKLNKKLSLVMAEREPKKYSSAVKVYTKDMKIYEDTIQVNKPFAVKGWKIYQLDYDREKGRWSEMSTFKLVSDPWIPSVYSGIFKMLFGAIFLFVRKGPQT